jgi:hypothetical protein
MDIMTKSSVQIVFPATYPFLLLNSLPPKPKLRPSHLMGNPNDPNYHARGGQQNSFSRKT